MDFQKVAKIAVLLVDYRLGLSRVTLLALKLSAVILIIHALKMQL